MAEALRRRQVRWLRLDRENPVASEWGGEMWSAAYAGYLVVLDTPADDVKVGIGFEDRAAKHSGMLLAAVEGCRLDVCEWEKAVLDLEGFAPAGCVEHLQELTAGGWTEVRSVLIVERAVALAGVHGLVLRWLASVA